MEVFCYKIGKQKFRPKSLIQEHIGFASLTWSAVLDSGVILAVAGVSTSDQSPLCSPLATERLAGLDPVVWNWKTLASWVVHQVQTSSHSTNPSPQPH